MVAFSLDDTARNVNVPLGEVLVTVVEAALPKSTFGTFKFELVVIGLGADGTGAIPDVVVNVIADLMGVESGLGIERVSVLVPETFEFDETSLPGKLKATCFGDLASDLLVPGGLGTTADVEIGVVLAFVVIVEELRVTHVAGGERDLTAFSSSAWITTSGLILLAAANTYEELQLLVRNCSVTTMYRRPGWDYACRTYLSQIWRRTYSGASPSCWFASYLLCLLF